MMAPPSARPSAAENPPFALRLARYRARNPLALDCLTDDPATEQLTYRSDKADGPTAGTQALDPLEFLARLLTGKLPSEQ